MKIRSIGGSQYLITFVDDYSRHCFSYFMKHKSKTFEKFKEFKATAEKEIGMKIKVLRSNRGEYISDEFLEYLKKHKIRAETTAGYSPELQKGQIGP